MQRPTPEDSQANVYLDLWDVPGDLKVNTSANTSSWQFVWDTYTAPFDTQISARAVVDLNVGPNDVVHVDSLALTPAAQFRLPAVSVPEPGMVTLAAAGIALLLGWRCLCRGDRC